VQNLVDSVAAPELRVADPSDPEVVVSVNATVPVAVEGETVAVRFTLSPVVSVPVVVVVSTVVVLVGLPEEVVTVTVVEVESLAA
jgi:hypothetical protein